MGILNLFKKGGMSKEPVNSSQTQESKENEVVQSMEQPVKEEALDRKDSEGGRRIHNLIILDESGSMISIYLPALTGVNETLQTIRSAQEEHQSQEHFVTLVAFDSGHYNKIYNHVPANQAIDITNEQYRPNGGTPLYDAMGRSLTELRPKVSKDDIVLVTIITDGYENASREYDGPAIKALVETLKSEGWVFTYIGANQDVEAVATSMAIDNHLAFDAYAESTKAMFEREARARKKFFSKVRQDISMEKLRSGYFDEDEDTTAF